jgi:RimJ/RimL family protein N-acetyltransferase
MDAYETWRPPDPVVVNILTPRLLLRSYALGDVPALFEAVNASRDALRPYMPWARSDHHEPASSAQYVSAQILAAGDPENLSELGVGIFERGGGACVGATGFHDLRRDTVSAETGYWIRTDRAGRGYCTEAMRHFLSWLLGPPDHGGFGLRRVRLFCSAANAGSRRVLEKIGVPLEGRLRGDDFVLGVGVTDRLAWGLLAEDWDVRTHRPRDDAST